jgi:hypothetical protein
MYKKIMEKFKQQSIWPTEMEMKSLINVRKIFRNTPSHSPSILGKDKISLTPPPSPPLIQIGLSPPLSTGVR